MGYAVLVTIFVVLFLIFAGVKNNEVSKVKKRAKKSYDDLKAKYDAHESELLGLRDENQELGKYREIKDVEEHIKKAREKFDHETAIIRNEAEDFTKKTKSEALEYARKIKEKSLIEIENAKGNAKSIIEMAETKAKEIAGDTYEAKNNAEHYEKVVKAMKNVIKGYGDEYLKPTHSLLDDLAEEYGFKEAGEELKKARAFTKMMVIEGLAATCKYVEEYRKRTAMNFVIDAFNGKVDAILSRTKHDNYGKLEQEIIDAFSLVNNNGKAFRDAEIKDEYLKARISELEWAVRVFVLREEEREEQKRIREIMREEEKARREYEKAIKEAEKEERMLQKAMREAQKLYEKASEEEKAKYEKELQDLQEKLIESEEKNKRALSMAQQTKRGHVYVISNVGSFGEDVFKIGLTRRLEPLDRVKELGDASVPFSFDVHAMVLAEDAPALENMLHQKFKDNQLNKVNPRKEFFKLNLKEIKEEIEGQGIEAKWTLKAEAAEYRESLAIEAAMNSKN